MQWCMGEPNQSSTSRSSRLSTSNRTSSLCVIYEGVGANVLDGPLQALPYFVREMQACPGAANLKAGDMVTIGTWTDAWPLEPERAWRAEFDAPCEAPEIGFP